jgi:HSP20 family protein
VKTRRLPENEVIGGLDRSASGMQRERSDSFANQKQKGISNMNSLVTRCSPSYSISPLASLLSFSRDFDRLVEGTPELRRTEESFVPVLELREDGDRVTVSVELAGVDKKDVSVTLHDGVLTIAGERKQEKEVQEGEYVRTERYYGRFERQVGLTQPVVSDQIKAAYKDGVLTITLPKAAEARPKAIDISGG